MKVLVIGEADVDTELFKGLGIQISWFTDMMLGGRAVLEKKKMVLSITDISYSIKKSSQSQVWPARWLR